MLRDSVLPIDFAEALRQLADNFSLNFRKCEVVILLSEQNQKNSIVGLVIHSLVDP